MLPKTLDSFGGPRVDAKAPSNLISQYPSTDFNRAHEDVAQMTRTIPRVVVLFPTSAAGPADLPAGTVQHRSVWGTGSAQKPTVTKTATGLYTVTWATTYTDALGVVESVALIFPIRCMAFTSDAVDDLFARILTIGSNALTLMVESPRGTLADVGDNSAGAISVSVAAI
jgi:hypothetical protein